MKKPKRNKPNPGKQYEKIVADIHRRFSDGGVVTEDELVVGRSGRERQIDVALRTDVAGYPLLVVVECKDYKRRVEIGQVEELIGKINDVNAAKGVLVSDSGFSAGAIERAKIDSRIQLASVIDTENQKLRTRIYKPTCISHHFLEYPSRMELTVEGAGLCASFLAELDPAEQAVFRDREQSTLREEQIVDVFTRFYAWYGDNGSAGRMKAGTHEFYDVITLNADIQIKIKIPFTKTVRCYVNDTVCAKGVGIYDHVNHTVLKSDGGLTAITIDTDMLSYGWREVPEGYTLKDCKTYYIR